MGHFIQLGGILDNEKNIQKAIDEIKVSHEVLNDVGYYSEKADRTLLFFDDDDFGAEEALLELSKKLNTSAFYFHVHDGDLWMYKFYVKGEELDKFNTSPDYWEKLSEEDRKSWSGNPEVIVKNWKDVKEEEIERYLTHDDEGGKAYPDDDFEKWDIWQLTDFTAKLGMPYPDDQEEED